MEPLSFDNVIKECNKKDTLKRKEARTIGNSKGQAEAMKKGEVSPFSFNDVIQNTLLSQLLHFAQRNFVILNFA
jgi:hypothetical protein